MSGPEGFDAILRPYLEKIKAFEKNIAYMYVDTTGNVTVGMGHNVTAHNDYRSLKFKVKRFERKAVKGGDRGIAITANKVIDRPATGIEIQNDFDFLTKHKKLGNYAADNPNLHLYTTVELDQVDREALFWSDIAAAITKARSGYGQAAFNGYPTPCQAGIIDIMFNTGQVFPKLKRAANGEKEFANKPASERWTAAAAESYRPQLKDEKIRNATVAEWFTAGAVAAKAKEDAGK